VTARLRLWLFLVGALGLGALLVWGLAGLEPFGAYPGPYGTILNRVAVTERHATDVVAAVTFDYRGFDTLGEELILFAAVAGVAMQLREVRAEDVERRRGLVGSDAWRAVGLALSGSAVVLGLFVVAHGYITPGGGFQGGVVLAAGAALVYVCGEYRAFERLTPAPLVEGGHGTGAAAFTVTGIATAAASAGFLYNALPLGETGTLASSGTIALLNTATGLEVAAAFVLLSSEFLQEVMAERPPRGPEAA
jgi:multicomponent Na+:H+ antiporter subunit B